MVLRFLLPLLVMAALTSATSTTTCPRLGSGTTTVKLTKNQQLVLSLSTTKTSTVTLCLTLGNELPNINGVSKSTTTLLPGTELRELRIEFPNFIGMTQLRIDSWDLRFGTNCTSNLAIPVLVLDPVETMGSLLVGNCSSGAEPFGFATTAVVNADQRLSVALLGGSCSMGTTALNEGSVCVEDGPPQTQSFVTILTNRVDHFDMNGVLYYIGSIGKKHPFSAQRLKDAGVAVTASEIAGSALPSDILYRLPSSDSFTVTSSVNQYYQIDLGARFQLRVTEYTLRHGMAAGDRALRTWDLLGANTLGTTASFVVLKSHSADTALGGANYNAASWLVPGITVSYRYFKIEGTGMDSSSTTNHVAVGGVELYGELTTLGVFNDGYNHDMDYNGVLTRIGSSNGKQFSVDELMASGVVFTSAEQQDTSPLYKRDQLTAFAASQASRAGLWVMLDLGETRKVVPTRYTLRHGHDKPNDALRNWRFEGSNNAEVWTTLKTHTDDKALSTAWGTYSWTLSTSVAYRFFRVLSTGVNSDNNNHLRLSWMELYGAIQSVQRPARDVGHAYQLGNGVLYKLGTSNGQHSYSANSIMNAGVSVVATRFASGSPTEFLDRIDNVVKAPPSVILVPHFYEVDLGNRKLLLNRYGFRHYATTATEIMRNWRLEGREAYGSAAVVLRTHTNDETIDGANVTWSWDVSTTTSYRYFRLTCFGVNKDGSTKDFLVTDMELWGLLSELPAVVNSDGYQYDFDRNGILYKLGTDGDSRSYSVERLKSKYITVQYPRPPGSTSDPYFLLERTMPTSDVSPYGAAAGVEGPSYFVVDFSTKRKLTVSRYTLRHGIQDDQRIIRNWNLEGSNDGLTWTVLRAHTDDTLIQTGYGAGSWVVTGAAPYRMFRALRTGYSSNSANTDFCVSRVEFYGTVTDQTVNHNYICDFCGGGAIVSIMTRGGTFPPSIHRLKEAGITVSSEAMTNGDPAWCYLYYLDQSSSCASQEVVGAKFQLDMGARTVTNPTHFTIRTSNSFDSRPQNFKLEGSTDGTSWTLLHSSSTVFAVAEHTAVTFPITSGAGFAYRYFRVQLTGTDSSGTNVLRFKGFDIYGILTGNHVPVAPTVTTQSSTLWNGVFKKLGTNGGALGGTVLEPLLTDGGLSAVWSSGACPPLTPLKVVTSDCRSAAATNSFWQVDIGPGKTVVISSYTLRSGFNNLHYLRSWNLDCLDTPHGTWQSLHTVSSDTTMTTGAEEQSFTPASYSCRIIRITQTAANSDGTTNLVLRGFEIHGTVSGTLTTESDGYRTDFDEAGYFYKAGVNQQEPKKHHSAKDLHNIRVAASSVPANHDPFSPLFRGVPVVSFLIGGSTPWWQVALPFNRRLLVSRYTIRHGGSDASNCLISATLQGSENQDDFHTLHTWSNTATLCYQHASATWVVSASTPNTNQMRFFRILGGGPFDLGGFELYGGEHSLGAEADKYEQDFDENGILYNIGTGDHMVDFSPQRVADAGVTMRFASQGSANACDTAYLMDRMAGNRVCYCKIATEPYWFEVDMGIGLAVCPSRYTLRHGDATETHTLRNWDFKGSNDGVVWTTVHTKTGNTQLQGAFGTATFTTGLDTMNDQNCYRYFRWYSSSERITLGGVEFYGRKKTLPIPSPLPPANFDTTGILYQFGTRHGAAPYGEGNLFAQGITYQTTWVSASRSLFQRDAFSATSCSSGNQIHWAQVDFGSSRRVTATRYSLRHGNDKHDKSLKNWKLEASNDRMTWSTIRTHTNDIQLDAQFGTASWNIDSAPGYQVYRVTSTDQNQDVCLKQIEFYGSVATVLRPLDNYEHDFDTNGILYHLGSAGKTLPFSIDRIIAAGPTPILSNNACIGTTLTAACWAQRFWIFNRDSISTFVMRAATFTDTTPSVGFDFGTGRRVRPTRYTLKHSDSWTDLLTAWEFQGSVDNVVWTTLHTKLSTDNSFSSAGFISMSWPLVATQAYRSFRVKVISNTAANNVVKLSGMELYGDLSEVAPPADGYLHDFDTNGVIYALGTAQHTRIYSPSISGVTATWGTAGPASVLEKEDPPVLKCSQDAANEFLTIVFPNPVKATRYSLRHGFNTPTRLLRNWKLQGRLTNGETFVDIKVHTDDKGLNGDFGTFSWEISAPATGYREFKILMTGQTSDLNNWFCISDVEFYGSVLV